MANYLILVSLPVPQNEHLKIVEVIKKISKGDFRQFPMGKGHGGYLLSSDKPIYPNVFDRIIMNGDAVLILELGATHSHFGFSALDGWLSTHSKK